MTTLATQIVERLQPAKYWQDLTRLGTHAVCKSRLQRLFDGGCSNVLTLAGVSFPTASPCIHNLRHEGQMSPGKLNRKRIFTPSDDALIRQQAFTGMSLKTLETMLRTDREALMRRAEELGVSLVIHDDYDEAVDPLRLKRTHGDWK